MKRQVVFTMSIDLNVQAPYSMSTLGRVALMLFKND